MGISRGLSVSDTPGTTGEYSRTLKGCQPTAENSDALASLQDANLHHTTATGGIGGPQPPADFWQPFRLQTDNAPRKEIG